MLLATIIFTSIALFLMVIAVYAFAKHEGIQDIILSISFMILSAIFFSISFMCYIVHKIELLK